MHWLDPSVAYAIVAIGSLLLATVPFVPRYRSASLWLRLGFFLIGPIGIAWSGLGFYLRLNERGDRTLLSWPRFWALDHIKANIAGLALGMLLCLVLSPEFRSFRRRKTSNQSLESTAARRDAQSSFHETVLCAFHTRRRKRWLSSVSLGL
jgi:hypothetical protein